MSHQPNPDSSGELAWPPYDTVTAPVVELDFWSELSDVEQQRIRELASQLDAAVGVKPGTSLSAFIAVAMKSRTVQP